MSSSSPPRTSAWPEANESSNNIRPSGLPLSSIDEDTEPPSTATHSRKTKGSIAWPFHTRNASESASTTLSMKMRSSWNPRNFFRAADDNISISRSIVPDYVIHYMRGETPETLAKKRQEREEDERRSDALVVPHRTSVASTPVQFGDIYSSSTDLTRGGLQGSARSTRSRYLSGWRGGLRLNAVLLGVIFLVTLSCFLVVVAKTKSISGSIQVYSGTCSGARQTNIGLHVGINILTIGILAAANYTLQVFSSPTREEIDVAHQKRRWLDIGLPSIRNFRNISGVRGTLALSAVVCATANQVIYNGVVFETQGLDRPDSCGVNASVPMLLTAAAMTFAVLLCTGAAFIIPRFDPIITIGDAIRSFMRVTDPTTAERCLMTKLDVQKGRWVEHEARYFPKGRHWWFLSPSFARWFLTALSFLSIAAPSTVAVIIMVHDNGELKYPPIGTSTPSTTFIFPPISIDSLVPRVILACLPQLLLAILYLSANAILTCYFLSHEFSLFAKSRQQLRVSSNPVSAQTSSLYLTLPRPISWFLLALFAVMGVFLSLSVFAVMAPSLSEPSPQIQIGVSSTALLVLLGFLALLLLVILGMGLRRAPAAAVVEGETVGNPLALTGGSCSAVISSRCHGRSDEDGRGALSWGVMEEARGMQIGHCAFSVRDLGVPEGRGLYA